MLYSCEKPISRKYPVLRKYWENSVPFTSQYKILSYLSYYPYNLSSDCLQEAKSKRKFQTFTSRIGQGELWEVIACNRFQILWFDLETLGILENCLQRRSGRLQGLVTTRHLTVYQIWKMYFRTFSSHLSPSNTHFELPLCQKNCFGKTTTHASWWDS